ncbi:MAG: hypothetical protein RIS52_1150 [Pseudomonadota bacterium]
MKLFVGCALVSLGAALPALVLAAPRTPQSPPISSASKPKAVLGKKAVIKAGSISQDDYPPVAMRAGQQGISIATFTVGANGKVVKCSAEGAGAILDAQSCKLLMERFIFDPARDARGRAVPETRVQRINWKLDQEDIPVAQQPVFINGTMTVGISTEGKVTSCRIAQSSGDALRDSKACQLALDRWKFVPASDAAGAPATSERTLPIPLPD